VTDWLLFAVVVAGSGVAAVKWLRVAQREHYLLSGFQASFQRWSRVGVANRLLGLIPWLAPVAVLAGLPGWSIGLGGVARAVFPLGLSYVGTTSKLAWTTRLRRLVAIYGGIMVLATAIALIWGPIGAGAVLLISSLLGLPIALAVAAPVESRLSARFVDEATESLRRIDPTIVAITGSYGKTSTKEYIRHLVSGSRQIVASPASFNNRMGLARAVNEQVAGGTEVFVAEMGTYGPGEIAELCRWVQPDIAVMTAIGPVHLERFGHEDRIVTAKSEILAGARVAVLNADDRRLAALTPPPTVERIVRCSGTDRAADVAVIEHGHRIAVWRSGTELGRADHPGVFLTNLACAVAVALELGVEADQILGRIDGVPRPAHRQTVSVSDAGFTIIDDTYNANPAGAAAALDRLAEEAEAGRRVVVTPGMVELGRRQFEENESFARRAAEVADDVVIVGRTNRLALRKGTNGGSASVIVVPDRARAVDWVRANLGPGDAVLYENDLPDHYP